MRVLNNTEIETVSGGCWRMWSWCKPKTTTCTPTKPTPPTCTPVKPPACGTPAPTPEIN